MKFYAGDIFRGASIPLREAIRGDDALENFKTASKQGISNFFKQGMDEWDKFKKSDEVTRDRIKLLMRLGVKNKEFAVALAGQDEEAFKNMVTTFNEAQTKTQDILTLRDHVRAQGIPTEDVLAGAIPSIGGEGEIDKKVVEDLTNETVDEVVSRVIGTVTPGTFSANQEKGFSDYLKDHYAQRGFGDDKWRSDLIRTKALSGAAALRPVGVSEEDWLGFMQGKITRGTPSEVQFRAPFSRAAEREEQVAELGFETAKLQFAELQSKMQDIKDLDTPIASYMDLEHPSIIKMFDRVGVSADETTTVRQFKKQSAAVGWLVDAFDKLTKDEFVSLSRTDVGAVRSDTRGLLVGYFGKGLDMHPVSGSITFKDNKVYRQSQLYAINKATLGAMIVSNEAAKATRGNMTKMFEIRDAYLDKYLAKYALDELKNIDNGVDLEQLVLTSTQPKEEVKRIMVR